MSLEVDTVTKLGDEMGTSRQGPTRWREKGAPIPHRGPYVPPAVRIWLEHLSPATITAQPPPPEDPAEILLLETVERVVEHYRVDPELGDQIVDHGRSGDWQEEVARQRALHVYDERQKTKRETALLDGSLITVDQQLEREEARDRLFDDIIGQAPTLAAGLKLPAKARKALMRAIADWQRQARGRLAEPTEIEPEAAE